MMNINRDMKSMAEQILQPYGNRDNALRQMRQQAGNNPILNNALDLFEKGDYNGLNNIGNNILREKNLNPMQAFQQIFGGRFGR